MNGKLLKLKNDKLITDYNLQQIRGRKHIGSVTTSLVNPTIKTYRKILLEDKPSTEIEKITYASEVTDFSPVFDEGTTLVYNLLYFLSILRHKFLLKSRLGVHVTHLPKLYEINKIQVSDGTTQTDFLNQIEIRARKRGILSYALFMRSYGPKSSDVLVFEMPSDAQTDKKVLAIIDKLQIFSFLGQITLADRFIFIIPGVSHQHPISTLIQQVIAKTGIESTFYTINLSKSRFVPFHDLYDFDDQKWKITKL